MILGMWSGVRVRGLQAPREDPEGVLKINDCRWDLLSPVRTEQDGLRGHALKDFGEIQHGSSNRREPKALGDFSENSDHLPKGSVFSGLGQCGRLGIELTSQS